MGSQHEDTTVENLDVENLSDEELSDIAENDTRSTAQDKAKAEIAARADDDPDPDDADPDDESGPHEPEVPDAPTREEIDANRAEAPVKDNTGEVVDPQPLSVHSGARQVQAARDAEQKQGFWDGTTDPADAREPDKSHTVAGVTGDTTLQDLVDSER